MNTLLQYLGQVESLVVRLVGKRVAMAAAVARHKAAELEQAQRKAEQEELLAASQGSSLTASQVMDTPAVAAAPSTDEPGGGAGKTAGKKARITVVPPPLNDTGAVHHHDASHGKGAHGKGGGGGGGGGGDGAKLETLKFGRASLRSELMSQILAGVTTQMDRLAEEDRAASKEGGGHGGSGEQGGRGGRLVGSTGNLIDKAQRDSSIDEWLARRRGGPPQHAPNVMPIDELAGAVPPPLPTSHSGHSLPANNSNVLAMGASMPPGRVPRRSGGSMNAKGSALGGNGSGLRGNKSAPMLFKADSGREIFTQVTRITADRASSRAFAAEMLPKLADARGAVAAALPVEAGGLGGAPSGAGLADGSAASLGAGYGGEYGGGEYGDNPSYGDLGFDSLAEPRREIDDINRRLALLEQERLQIHQLKHMALAAGTLAEVAAAGGGGGGGEPGALGGGNRLHSSTSLQALDRNALNTGGGGLPPAVANSRSSAVLSAGRQRVR